MKYEDLKEGMVVISKKSGDLGILEKYNEGFRIGYIMDHNGGFLNPSSIGQVFNKHNWKEYVKDIYFIRDGKIQLKVLKEPMIFSMENFKNNKLVVNCTTEQDAKVFLAYLTADKTIRWMFDKPPISNIKWNIYEEKTCYCFNFSGDERLAYSEKSFYIKAGCDIIEFKIDLLK